MSLSNHFEKRLEVSNWLKLRLLGGKMRGRNYGMRKIRKNTVMPDSKDASDCLFHALHLTCGSTKDKSKLLTERKSLELAI